MPTKETPGASPGRRSLLYYGTLYVYHGTDIATSAKKARALIDSLRTKRPDAAFAEMIADQWDPSALEGHLGTQGLFSSKYVVLLNRVTENADAKEALPSLIGAMNESPNIFIVLEAKLNAELKRAVEKSAEKAVLSDVKDASAKPEFNVFALAGALAAREPFKAWSLYRQAIDGGSEPEAIAGMLFWKAKSMGSTSLARRLITLYHDGHRGILDLEWGIEKLLLSC